MKKTRRSSSTEGGKRISRLQFLKLLGAGAIGYFLYRAGFINSLFVNATPANSAAGGTGTSSQTLGWLSTAVAAAADAVKLDEDGILMMATPKPGGYSYRFNPTLLPSKDIRLDVKDTAGFEIKQENSVRFIRFMSHNPGTGEGSNTVRLHVFTEDRSDADNQKYTWINGAPDMGWLTHPEDLKNGEWTFICRPNNILDVDAISAKLGGGEHRPGSPQNDEASCWNVNWYYDASTRNLITFEFIQTFL
jgi:hypothetical protein